MWSEWECELNGTGDEDDDILGMGCESAEQSKWERLAALAQQKTSYLQASAIMSNSVQLAGLMRALDFVEPAERESAITIRGSSRFE